MSRMNRYRWERLGCVYSRTDEGGPLVSHVTRPIPVLLPEKGIIRIFHSSRDANDIPHPTFVDVDAADPTKIVHVAQTPMLSLGRPGTFDDSGITPTSFLPSGGGLLYYVGWKRRRTHAVSIEASIGVARLDAATGEMSRMFEGPIIGQDIHHPFMTAAPFVTANPYGFEMWYCSGTGWTMRDQSPEMLYSIRHAVSKDGIHWTLDSGFLIEPRHENEIHSAPWIRKVDGRLEMWFSSRGVSSTQSKNFSPSFAYSTDGTTWTRNDDLAGLSRSKQGFDSEMLCYPALIESGAHTFLFYSGNGVGRGGLGVARMISHE
jgi:hypothetical protein